MLTVKFKINFVLLLLILITFCYYAAIVVNGEIEIREVTSQFQLKLNENDFMDGNPLRQCRYYFVFVAGQLQQNGDVLLYNMPSEYQSFLNPPIVLYSDPDQVIITVTYKVNEGTQGNLSVSLEEKLSNTQIQTGSLDNFYQYNCVMSSSRQLTTTQTYQTLQRLNWLEFYYSFTLLNYTYLVDPIDLQYGTATPFVIQSLSPIILPTKTPLSLQLCPSNLALLTNFADASTTLTSAANGNPSTLDVLFTAYNYSPDNVDSGVNTLSISFAPIISQYYRGWNQIYSFSSIDFPGNDVKDKVWFGSFDGNAQLLPNQHLVFSNTAQKFVVAFGDISPVSAINQIKVVDMLGSTLNSQDFTTLVINPISPEYNQYNNFQTIGAVLNFRFPLNDIDCQVGYLEQTISAPYPYGWSRFTDPQLQLVYAPIYMVRVAFRNNPPFSLSCKQTSVFETTVNPTSYVPSTNTNPPVLVDFRWTKLDKRHVIIHLQVTSDNGLDYIEFNSFRIQALNALVGGTTTDGSYEFMLTLDNYAYYDTLIFTDMYRNQLETNAQQFFSSFSSVTDSYPLPYFIPLIVFTPSDITFFQFSINQINTTGRVTELSLFIQFENQVEDMLVSLLLDIPFTDQKPFYAVYAEDLEMFVIKFTLPANLIGPSIPYDIVVNYNPIKMYQLIPVLGVQSVVLQVSSQVGDQMPPLITKIQISNAGPVFNSIMATFTIVVEDQENGFKEGMVHITSPLDVAGHKFLITSQLIPPNGYTAPVAGSTSIKSTFVLTFPVSDKCIQDHSYYTITSSYLIDKQGYKSDSSDTTKINPVVQIIGNENFTLPISGCTTSTNSYITITSLNVSSNSLVANGRDAQVTFSFLASDTTYGIPNSNRPTVYLTTVAEKPLECLAEVTVNSANEVKYQCSITIPAFFGYNDGIFISIYGLINNQYIHQGFNSEALYGMGLPHSITWNKGVINWEYYTPNIQSILPYEKYSEYVTIRALIFNGDNVEASVTYHNGETSTVEITSLSSVTVFEVEVDTTLSILPFNIVLKTTNGASDPILVTPIEPLLPPPETIPPTPKPCQGTPTCGGSDKGTCTQYGCKCTLPWTGVDCLSQILIYKLPPINETAPTYLASLSNLQNSSFTCKTFMHSLQEINFKGEVVSTVNLLDKQWTFVNDTNTYKRSFQYSTSFIQNSVTTKLNVTLTWLNKSRDLDFAGQRFTVSPSTYKYSITISKFGFQQSLNTLKLIFDTDLEYNEATTDVCSSKHSSTDDMFRYTRLRIGDMTLLSRYVNYAIIDDRNTLISNEPVNLQEKISYNTTNLLVAINIPHYNVFAILDPDFSVLLDSKPTDAQTENSICFSDDSSNSKSSLSKTQIAGIIVGSVVGGLCIIGVTLYIVFRKYKYSKIILSLRERTTRK
ncbi:hypothetical protein DLAC_03013 [Tieghemostelium lacteum]|uniref:EGF-like domain-containing protein n=1 Tax=Tieghemostelium lacteum TaxID=361077 RepID=A0A152A3Y2_TIELA|nr:hypothetical protein DLAC_03013 [Tieghemostelium lacteum]|eukprot:KYR00948.1 hypothetical protein DLAC_03013 [Tieghemostelium lacteum]